MIEKTSSRLGLKWVLPILIASQWILRQYFPENTHALLNDWAYFTFYFIFFLCGFVLFTSDKVINALASQRHMYLIQTFVFTIVLFSFWVFEINIAGQDHIYGITEITIAWSCGLSAIGYFKVHFNKDNKYRKHLNVAIYPFYLLHQPVIVVVGYLVLKLQMTTITAAILITLLSFSVIIGLYWIIDKINFLRIIFGLKKIPGHKSVFKKRKLQQAA